MDDATQTAEGLLRGIRLRGFDGAPLRAYVGGLSDGPAVVLVNALGLPFDFWLPLARRLASRFKILTWESRGVTDDEEGFDAGSCDVACHVNDLLALLESEGVDGAHLVAWCNGAQVALRCASSQPGRVRRLVLLNGTFNLPEDVPRTSYEKNMRVLMPKIAGNIAYANLYHRMMNASGAQPGSAAGGQEADAMLCSDPALLPLTSAPFRTPARLYRYATLITRTLDEPTHTWAEGVKAPVLVVSGARDRVSHPGASLEIARRIKDARLVMLEEGDHYSMYHDEQLQQAVRDFLSDV
jgi:pimeloyl-ACP methyl ester carboxylesterase